MREKNLEETPHLYPKKAYEIGRKILQLLVKK